MRFQSLENDSADVTSATPAGRFKYARQQPGSAEVSATVTASMHGEFSQYCIDSGQPCESVTDRQTGRQQQHACHTKPSSL